ncbi:MAG: C2H2-type zinc finger protein [Smithellaceae bacterium]
MDIKCKHCHMEFGLDDIVHTLKKGHFKCPVCGKKIPSPLAEHQESTSPSTNSKYLIPVFIGLGIVAVFAVIYFLTPADKTRTTNAFAPAIKPSSSSPPPPQINLTPAPPVPSASQAVQPESPQASDKMKIVKAIAAQYHTTHSYTQQGGFVCLDMANDVWNQLAKSGIEAKIMGGTVKENVTSWNYRQLVLESNHAWVVAKLSPTEKVAIETTAGVVIQPGMENASAYFKGIVFDNPDQIKRFERLRIKLYEVCGDAHQLTTDWNENVAGKQRISEETITKQSRLEQRKQDCERTFGSLKEFESRAIFY